MRKILLVMVAVASLAFAGTVSANNGSSVTKYDAAYSNPIGGNWTCNGVRVVNKNYTKDSFTCTVTNLAPGTYSTANFGWISDYDGQNASSFTLIVTDNGDGTGNVEGEAFYG